MEHPSTTGRTADAAWAWAATAAVLAAFVIHVPAALNPLDNFDPPKRLVWSLFALAAIVAGCLREQRRRGAAVEPLSLVLLALIAWMVLRLVFKPNPWCEAGELVVALLPILTFQAGRLAGESRIAAQILAVGFGIAATSQGVLMLAQLAGYDPLFADATADLAAPAWRMIGTVGYQNQAAAALALTAGAAGFLCHAHWIRLLVPLFGLGIVCLTGSRGATAAAVAAVAAAWLVTAHTHASPVRGDRGTRRRWMRAWPAALAVAIGLVAAFAVPALRVRLAALSNQDSPAAGLAPRRQMAAIAAEMVREHPLVGCGAGSFAYQYLDRLGRRLPTEKSHAILASAVYAREAHNDPLQFLAEFGLIGGCLATAAFVLVTLGVWRGNHAAAGVFVLVYMALHACVSLPWHMAVAGPLAGLILGFCVGNGGRAARGCAPDGRRRSAWAVAAGSTAWCLTATTCFAWSSVDTWLSLRCPAVCSIDEAQRLASRMARALPWTHRYQAFLGGWIAYTGDCARAIPILEHAATGFQDPLLYNNLGHCYAETGRWEDARRLYTRWAACGVRHRDALDNLTVTLEQLGRYGESADVEQWRTTLWPDWSDAHIQRWCVLMLRAGRTADALQVMRKYYDIAARHNYAPPAALDNLMGVLLRQSGDVPHARGWFERALEKQPDLESARRNLRALPSDAHEP